MLWCERRWKLCPGLFAAVLWAGGAGGEVHLCRRGLQRAVCAAGARSCLWSCTAGTGQDRRAVPCSQTPLLLRPMATKRAVSISQAGLDLARRNKPTQALAM